MSQEVQSSVLEKIDVFFTRIFNSLFKWSWPICLFVVGAAALYIQYIVIFGNDAGLADVSTVEFFFFVIAAGLIWRLWYYGKKNSQPIFVTLAKTLMNAGAIQILFLALCSLVFFVAYAEGKSLDKFMSTLFKADYLGDLIAMAFWILVFYFSAPVVKNITLEKTEVAVDELELVSASFKSSELKSSELKSSYLKSAEVEKTENNEKAEGTPEYQNEVKV